MYASGAFAAPPAAAAASALARPGLALLHVVAGPLVGVPGLHLGKALALALGAAGPGLILRPLLAAPASIPRMMMLPLLVRRLLRGHRLEPVVGAVVALESAHICLALVVTAGAAAASGRSGTVAKLTRRLELVARPHSVLGVIGGVVGSEGRVEAAVVCRHHARCCRSRHLLIPGGGAETNLKLQRGGIRKAFERSLGMVTLT